MISTRIVLCSARGILARARRPGGARDAWTEYADATTRDRASARARCEAAAASEGQRPCSVQRTA